MLNRNINNFIFHEEMSKSNLERDAYELYLKDQADDRAFIAMFIVSRMGNNRTFEGQNRFWEIYLDTSNRGNKRWYNFYRMSRQTFRYIIKLTKPHMHPNPSLNELTRQNEETKNLLYIATIVRYLGSKCDQTQLAYDFGVTQGTISKRLRIGSEALLKTFYNQGCPFPKVRMPSDVVTQRKYAEIFKRKTRGIRYIIGL